MFRYLTEENKMTSSQTLSFNNIEWEVLDTPIARDFSKFLMEEIDKCQEFYFMGETAREIKDEIDKIVYLLGFEPSDFYKGKYNKNYDFNKLHEHFADNENDPEMSRLNNLIHYHELIDSNFPPRWGYEQGTSISEMFLAPWTYEYFTLNRKAGYLYVNYAHVGKHFAEIAFSGDYEIKKGQYIPQQSARPSFMCWLGDDINPMNIPQFVGALETAHITLKERLNLPDLDDPALRLGYIPFAKLKHRINTNDLQKQLLSMKGKNAKYMELFDGRQR